VAVVAEDTLLPGYISKNWHYGHREYYTFAEDSHTPNQELVGDAISQWCLWAHDSKVNPLFLSYLDQRLNISWANVEILGNLSRAGVARGGVNFINFGALG